MMLCYYHWCIWCCQIRYYIEHYHLEWGIRAFVIHNNQFQREGHIQMNLPQMMNVVSLAKLIEIFLKSLEPNPIVEVLIVASFIDYTIYTMKRFMRICNNKLLWYIIHLSCIFFFSPSYRVTNQFICVWYTFIWQSYKTPISRGCKHGYFTVGVNCNRIDHCII